MYFLQGLSLQEENPGALRDILRRQHNGPNRCRGLGGEETFDREAHDLDTNGHDYATGHHLPCELPGRTRENSAKDQ